MRKTVIILCTWTSLFGTTNLNAQINANPDPNGEPWWVGGELITPETQSIYDALPEFQPQNHY